MKKILTLILALCVVVAMLAGCAPAETQDSETVLSETTEETASEESTTEESTTEETSDEEEVEEKTIGLDAFKVAMKDNSTLLIDTRSTYAFNGWALENEQRGGHVEGATVFSASWLAKLEDAKAVQVELDRYGISKDKAIVTYGYGSDTATKVANKLEELGYENVKTFEEGFKALADDSEINIVAMDHYELLVHPAWVNDGLEKNEITVFEASWGSGDNYKKAHIPGAAHINTDDFEEGPLWNRKSDVEIEKSLLSNGITKDMTVVLYGDDITASSRIALILKYAGVEDVRLLDGGFTAWKESGFEVAQGGVDAVPVEEFGAEVPQNPGFIIDMEEAKEVIADENSNLISIRSWIEFTGETSGYDYIEAAGRIDGAVYGFAGSDPWHMEDYRTPDNTMVNYEYMVDRWEKQNITMDNVNSFYCGTGWRASETWFYALAIGWENVSVYDGGWKEWSETQGNPTAKGDPTSN